MDEKNAMSSTNNGSVSKETSSLPHAATLD
jgi:hypothetical protein